jgi:hypothetical protein
MDKGWRNQRKVSVTYNGDTQNAKSLDEPPLSNYEAGPYSGPSRDCYRVEVRAHNRYGTTTRSMRADTIGTNGCD